MKAYHSTFLAEEDANARIIGNMAVLPIKTQFRGPAIPCMEEYDIIDEVLDLFRANTFFKNFEIKGAADRVLIYGILFVSQSLNTLAPNTTQNNAVRLLTNLALDDFAIPGDAGFPLNAVYLPPATKNDAVFLRQYLSQFRQELASRLIQRLYQNDPEKPSKFWLAFSRKKFMNKAL